MAQKKITELQLRDDVDGTLSIPADDGIETYRVTPSQLFDYLRPLMKPLAGEISNLQITTAVGSSALTIALKTNAGTDPSATDKIRVVMRNATATSGAFLLREISSALSLVVSSGSTLGQVSGQASRIWVYLIDNAGTLELAVSHKFFSDDTVVSTTAEGGAGAADSATVMYSSSARSSVACRVIGYIDNTQATAGTWASAGTTLVLLNGRIGKAPTRTVISSGSSTYYKPAGCRMLRVRMSGGGGGGNGSGTSQKAGGTGGNTTFGSHTANGGGAGGSDGGSFTIAGDGTGLGVVGGRGGGYVDHSIGTVLTPGAMGGVNPMGGNGTCINYGNAGSAGKTNTGGGGGGGGDNATATMQTGAGGSAGGFIDMIISDPVASYAYSVGAAGAAGTSGATLAGGAGGSGVIIIDEYY